jgi:hypothetical protein
MTPTNHTEAINAANRPLSNVCLEECIECGSTIFGIYDELGFEPEENATGRPSAFRVLHTEGRYEGREKGWQCYDCAVNDEGSDEVAA